MQQKFYFFHTVIDEKGQNRLRPLPFQVDEGSKAVIPQLNTQADTTMRRIYPIGTVFGSDTLELRTSGTTAFYSAGDIYPLTIPEVELQSNEHSPSQELKDAYITYASAHPEVVNKEEKPIGQKTTTPVPKTMLDKIKLNPRFEKPTPEKDGFFVEENNWWDIILNLLNHQNTLLKGPTGTGKTELIQLVCQRLGIPLHIYDMGSMFDPISEMFGVHRMTKEGSVFDYAQFTQDIQQEGVILLDELSRATPAVNNILVPLLDSRRTLKVEMAGGKDTRNISVHPKCTFVATANIGAEYVGTNELDLVIRDRFDEMETNYMPEPAEVAMLTKRYKISKINAEHIVKTASAIRKIYLKGELPYAISTRETVRAAQKVANGWSTMVAMQRTFLPRYEGTLAEGSRAIVNNNILQN